MSFPYKKELKILYEDNHLIALNKRVSDIVQGDASGDVSLDEKLRLFIKERNKKPGNVFVGVPHRIDRPVSGVILYTKTSKALSRMTKIFKEKEIEKVYYAIVSNRPDPVSGRLEHYISRNTRQNKSYCHDRPKVDAKHAVLHYSYIGAANKYHLLKIVLETGRHHQIRAQLAKIGCTIKGDLKYGADRSNSNGGISLHARALSFVHPVRNTPLEIVAPFPKDDIYNAFKSL